MSEANDNDNILQLKVTGISELLLQDKRRTLVSALSLLYSSQLYKMLVNEELKLWHLSAQKLYDMLLREKKTGKLELPDYV